MAKLKVLRAKTPKRIRNILRDQLLKLNEVKLNSASVSQDEFTNLNEHAKSVKSHASKVEANVQSQISVDNQRAQTTILDNHLLATNDTRRKGKNLEYLKRKIFPANSIEM
jgi:hypothetical protein